jgi:hypothetical protein
MSKPKRHLDANTPGQLCYVVENDEVVLYCELDGRRIAKRYSGGKWISLEPGYTVRGTEPGGDYNSITIEYRPQDAEPQ